MRRRYFERECMLPVRTLFFCFCGTFACLIDYPSWTWTRPRPLSAWWDAWLDRGGIIISDYIIGHIILRAIARCLFVPLLFVFRGTPSLYLPQKILTLFAPTRPSPTCSLLTHLPLLVMGCACFVIKGRTSIETLIFKVLSLQSFELTLLGSHG